MPKKHVPVTSRNVGNFVADLKVWSRRIDDYEAKAKLARKEFERHHNKLCAFYATLPQYQTGAIWQFVAQPGPEDDPQIWPPVGALWKIYDLEFHPPIVVEGVVTRIMVTPLFNHPHFKRTRYMPVEALEYLPDES